MRLRANIFNDSCGITDHAKHMTIPNRPYQTEGKGRCTICALQFDSSIFSYKLLGLPTEVYHSFVVAKDDSIISSPVKG